MAPADIVIKGAREHNLRDVDLVLPRNQLICLTGVSGSGKSSLAFDTLFAEGQRRYVESLSSFARQFLGQMPKPDVDYISGLSPSISISQKSSGNNPRSTVGTITEIHDYLRLLYARVGQGHCPSCGREITAQTREQIIARILQLPAGSRFLVLAPVVRAQKGEHRDLFADLLKQGFARARVDGVVTSLADDPKLDRQMRHDIEVVVDRLVNKNGVRARLAESVDLALKIGDGNMIVAPDAEGGPVEETPPVRLPEEEDESEADEPSEKASEKPKTKRRGAGVARPGDIVLSADYACTHCSLSFEPPGPQLFSFNSPQGMCLTCDGLGELFSFDPALLIPNPALSFQQGCFELIGTWKDLSRWKRHIYQGLADTLERVHELEAGTILETAWEELPEKFQQIVLYGAGDLHITYTWRGGASPMKYGGKFEGVVPELQTKYANCKSRALAGQLEKYMRTSRCPACKGERLNPQARSVRITTASAGERFAERPALTLPDVCHLSIDKAVEFFQELKLDATGSLIAAEVLKEIRARLGFLVNVGLEYLSLDRTAPTLSGGESQRIRLAGQIGSGLVGVLYILDEPSIGLHPRDNDRLLATLNRLRDMGNTVVVVEHDEDTMRAADHIIDFGPGPGVRGGEVVGLGPASEIEKSERSVTGKYLSGELKIETPSVRRSPSEKSLKVIGAAHHNLKNVDVEIPLGLFVCVTGVSGSGKSSLVNDILVETLRRDLNKGDGEPGKHERIEGLEHLDKLIAIDQSPIGRTPRSNPGTYIKVFDEIRSLFTQLPEAKKRGYKPGRFSFNVAGGRCEACEGNGSNRLEMDFLADVWVTCPVCEGRRFNRETLQVRFKGKSIAEVLDMDIQQALSLFENVPKAQHMLQTLHDVGLDYLKVGQASPTLSGGEAQRVKLARELVKKSTGKTLYLLDEPTTGLHFADIKLLLDVLQNFVRAGNTVLVVEHNLDVIKTADWIIDLGPEGGAAGGRIVATGTPEQISQVTESHTGRSLAKVLGAPSLTSRPTNGSPTRKRGKNHAPHLTREIVVQGARQHNLKGVDARIERDAMTVFCGPSGSGKSSLAIDTIYAEGQRRYVESLSAYARQFVAQMQKPALDHIDGLSPAISIEQKNLGHTPRSTVGTVTEIYDYLRIVMARLGEPFCPACETPIGTQTADQVIDKVMETAAANGETDTRVYLMAPLEIDVGEKYETLWEDIRAQGYIRVRVDGQTHSLDEPPKIDRRRKHAVEVVIDRAVIRPDQRSRIADSVENALALGKGVLHVAFPKDDVPESKWRVDVHSQHLACDTCGRSFEPLTPHNFSFNSQLGWCPACQGLGVQTGANPAALLRDPKLTLAQGALLLWPNVDQPVSLLMLEALSAATGIPLNVPFEQLQARHRRIIMHGAGEEWLDVLSKDKKPRLLFRFQFKGLYPALEEASRLSPSFRSRLETFIDEVECTTCAGSRLRDDSAAVRFRGMTLDDICRLPLGQLLATIESWQLSDRERRIAGELFREITNRVRFLNDVGLEYLSVGRGAASLSNGEAQRIRLASQLGSGLCGVLYVLDEPTIGLHPRDNTKLLKALHKLRDLGNTLLVVEHDREVIEHCDKILDFGPAAGKNGGQIVAEGTPAEVARKRGSVTGPYISGKKAITVPTNRRPAGGGGWVEIKGARHHNLRNVNVRLPLGVLTAVTGPSGSGKSSLIDDVLYASLARTLHRAATVPGAHDAILGVDRINKVIRVDQQPLGNSPTSNPATYTGAFDVIRNLFSQLPEAKLRGFSPRRFSFNAPGGRCEACEGNGQRRIEMHFLPDVWVECDTCRGRRYNPETLAVAFHGRSISDVLDMTCGEAAKLFENIPSVRRILQTLCDVGLDYLTLGQPAPTLSGGEAQRVKLAAELSRPDTGRTLYLLDEPTTGLHFDDLAKLLEVLHRLVDLGNTVVLIEHNLDVIKSADWIIDMGPEAGEGGGQLVFAGTPEQLVKHANAVLKTTSNTSPQRKRGTGSPKRKRGREDANSELPTNTPLLRSHTGEALASVIERDPKATRKAFDFESHVEKREGDLDIAEVGKDARMPWEVDGRRWHTKDRVGRKGEPAKWDGAILEKVVDRIHELGKFSETDWNSRGVVEICGQKKSDGWFFHAITGETYLLKLKFRVYRGTFKRHELLEKLKLKTLNQIDELPIYGNEPRIACKTLRGPWQEVRVSAYSLEEVDTPEFWSFVEQSVAGFLQFTEKAAEAPEELTPWKKLGQKWHLSRKGFPPHRQVAWDVELLEELCELLTGAAPGGQFLWNNQQIVNLFVPGQREAWAVIHTKRPQSLDLTLTGPKGRFALGRVANLGRDRQFDAANPELDVIRLRFREVEDLHRGELAAFLKEHAATLSNGKA